MKQSDKSFLSFLGGCLASLAAHFLAVTGIRWLARKIREIKSIGREF